MAILPGVLTFAFILAAYLLGSIPFGLIAGRLAKGVDVREHGSGNIGFTNVYRVAGPVPGFIVLALDAGKGFLAVRLPQLVYTDPARVPADAWVVVACALVVILGHNWSIFLGFTGGKGIATGLGSVLAFTPGVALGVLAVWGVIVVATRYISLGSVVSVALYPPAVAIVYPGNTAYLAFGVVGASAVIFKHRSNLRRLMEGTERRVGGGRTAQDAPGPEQADRSEGGGKVG
jgi:glycerol-3-phosphate acyltransferase PlsY